MNPESYILIALLALSVLIMFLLSRKGKRPKELEQRANEEREARIFKLYQNLEDMMDSFESYVEQTREELDRDKAEAKALFAGELALDAIEDEPSPGQLAWTDVHDTAEPDEAEKEGEFTHAKFDIYNYVPDTQQLLTNVPPPREVPPRLELELLNTEEESTTAEEAATSAAVAKAKALPSKREKVLALRDEGMTSEQIARQLGLSKGEVSLIVEVAK